MSTAMQQLDQRSARFMSIWKHKLKCGRLLTFVLLDNPTDLLDACLQLATHSVS